MSSKKYITAIVAATVSLTAMAQSSFEDFRQGLLNDYNTFRQSVLDDYAKFLDGVWVEYDAFRGVERYSTPKPQTPPVATTPATEKPKSPVSPAKPASPTLPEVPAPTPAPAPAGNFSFDMHGVTLQIPDIDVRIMEKVAQQSDFAAQWRQLDADPSVPQLTEALKALSKDCNFNDWLTYELITAYASARYANATPSARTSFVHYIMTHLGFDARLGYNGSKQTIIMLPCKQTVYGHMYLMFDNEKYYVFTDPAVSLSPTDNNIYTCQLPKSASTAAKIDMRLKPLNIPYAPKQYCISDGKLKIEGETNANLYPFLYKYPQIPISDYAESMLLPQVRLDIISQLKQQLEGMERDQAIDTLLGFVQSGFEYATDGDNHGFEKPYFFEEMLFYDKCDCEDRVIFYTYLLWNVLGVENHLLAFPGHESAAVAMTPKAKSDSYNYDGKTFLISDPTYIGAHSGQCMPVYRGTVPEIDHIYK